MPLQSMADLFVKIIIMLALGFVLRKKNIITNDLQKGLNDLLLKAFLPVSILASANAVLTTQARQNLLLTAAIALGYYVFAIIFSVLISKVLPISKLRRSVFVTMAVFANTAFLGFPIIKELFGDEGFLYAVIYNLLYQLFFFTYGISKLDGVKTRFRPKNLYTNVVTIVSVISIGIFVSPLRLPSTVVSTLSTISGATVPISMLIIGASLATIKLPSILKDGYSYIVSALRLIVFPVLLLLVLRTLNLSSVVVATCVVMTALPCGSLNVINAQRSDCDSEYAVRTVIQTMLLMIVTIPAILFLLNA